MPIGTEEWRAGVGSYSYRYSLPEAFLRVSLCSLLATAFRCFAYLYLIIAVSLITLPVSVLTKSLFAHFPTPSFLPSSWQQNLVSLNGQRSNFALSTSYVIFIIYFLFSFSRDFIKINGVTLMACPKIRKQYMIFLEHAVYAFLISNYLDIFSAGENFPTKLILILILLAGDIETNPGPATASCLKFYHWNLNSVCARGGILTTLIEAYNSIHHFDVIAISESMFISNDSIFIEGFSREIFRSDYPSNSRVGGACVYFCEGRFTHKT